MGDASNRWIDFFLGALGNRWRGLLWVASPIWVACENNHRIASLHDAHDFFQSFFPKVTVSTLYLDLRV